MPAWKLKVDNLVEKAISVEGFEVMSQAELDAMRDFATSIVSECEAKGLLDRNFFEFLSLGPIIHQVISRHINNEGFFPYLGLAEGPEGQLAVGLMPFRGDAGVDISFSFMATMVESGSRQVIFGLDAYGSAEEGGAKSERVVTVYHWTGSSWRYGIVRYDMNPVRVQSLEWDNPWWSKVMAEEVADRFPGGLKSPQTKEKLNNALSRFNIKATRAFSEKEKEVESKPVLGNIINSGSKKWQTIQ